MVEKLENIEKNGQSPAAEIAEFRAKLVKLETDGVVDISRTAESIEIQTREMLDQYPGKWSQKDISDMYDLIKTAGLFYVNTLRIRYTDAINYVRKYSKRLYTEHFDSKKATPDFREKLNYAKDKFDFTFKLDFKWLGADALAHMIAVRKVVFNFGRDATDLSFTDTFQNLTLYRFNDYVKQIFDKAPSSATKIAYGKEKIIAALSIAFYLGALKNKNIRDENKTLALQYNQSIVEKIPGLFGAKRLLVADTTGKTLTIKRSKRKETVAPKEAEDTISFDEGLEDFPDVARAQINKLSLLSELASLSMPGKNINAAKFSLANIQRALLGYYKPKPEEKNTDDLMSKFFSWVKNEKYDGKTPFDLERAIREESIKNYALASLLTESNKFIGKYKKRAGRLFSKKIPYLNFVSILLANKSAMSMDYIRKAGFAISVIQREEGKFLDSRAIMARLIQSHILEAKGKLTETEKFACKQKAEMDTAKHMREYLSDGRQRETFIKNYEKAFFDENKRMPTPFETENASRANVAFLFNATFALSYDSHLVSASLSSKFMAKDVLSKMDPLDKEVYQKFYESVQPDGEGLSDENWKTYKNIGTFIVELGIIAASGGIAGFAGKGAGLLLGAISKGTKLVQVLNKLPMALQHLRHFTVFSIETATEVYTFSETQTLLGNAILGRDEKTITELFSEGKTEEAMLKVASQMPMFAAFKFGHAVSRYFSMTKKGQNIFDYALKNPQYKSLVNEVFAAVGSKSPAQAISRLKNILTKGGLPSEIKLVVEESIGHFDGIASKYSVLIKSGALDPASKKVALWLLRDLQFDALAMFFGEKAGSLIAEGKEQHQVDSNIIDQVCHAYFRAAALGGGLRLGGGLVSRLTLSKEDISYITSNAPAKLRPRIERALRSTTMANEGLQLETPVVENVREIGTGRPVLDTLRKTPAWKKTLAEIAVAISAVLDGGKSVSALVERTAIVETLPGKELPPLKEVSANSKNVVLTPEGGGKVGEASAEASGKIFSTPQEALLAKVRADGRAKEGLNLKVLNGLSGVSNSLHEFNPFVRFIPYFDKTGNLVFHTAIDSDGLAKAAEDPKNKATLTKMAGQAGLDVHQAGVISGLFWTYVILWGLSKLPIIGLVFKPIFSMYSGLLKGGLSLAWNKGRPLAKRTGEFVFSDETKHKKLEEIAEFPQLDLILDELGDLKGELSLLSRQSLVELYEKLQTEILKGVKYTDQAKAKNLFKNIIKDRALDLLTGDLAAKIGEKEGKLKDSTYKEATPLKADISALKEKMDRIEVLRWVIAKNMLANRTDAASLDFSKIEDVVNAKLTAAGVEESYKTQILDAIKNMIASFKKDNPRISEELWLALFEPQYGKSLEIAGDSKPIPNRTASAKEFELYTAAREFLKLYRKTKHDFDSHVGHTESSLRKVLNLPNKIKNPVARRSANIVIRASLVLALAIGVDRAAPYIVSFLGAGIAKIFTPDLYDAYKGLNEAYDDAFGYEEGEEPAEEPAEEGSSPEEGEVAPTKKSVAPKNDKAPKGETERERKARKKKTLKFR